jgi:hypothetical protein
MTLADAQQHRLLELLRKAGNQPISFAELHAGGISFPATVVSELELNGYPTSASMTTGGWSGCACSMQNAATHPRHADGAGEGGRTDSQLRPWRPPSCQARRISRSQVVSWMSRLGASTDQARRSLSRPTRLRRDGPRPGRSSTIERLSSPSQRPPTA